MADQELIPEERIPHNLEQEKHVYAMRHSLAHIMATAIQELYSGAKFGIGPVVEHGFYYDVDLREKLSEDDLEKIEAKMREIIKDDQPFEHSAMKLDEAIGFFQERDQPYKLDLLRDLKEHGTTVASDIDRAMLGAESGAESKVDEVGIYTNGPFTDLCRGPHVESTGKVGAFKLMRVSGAYWRGSEKNPQLQRVYGVGFATEKELRQHLVMLEEAEKRDHRKLGRELDLYTISNLVGSGLPLFTPKGSVLREGLGGFSQELQARHGFERVWTPHIAREEIYKVSGHFDKYPERFSVTSTETDDTFMMKPMNCPHHIQLFARKPWSYRELPVRYMENTTNYRDEKSGELHGLSRVRSLSQDDGHIFCRQDQFESEIAALIDMVKAMYDTLGMTYVAHLSYRDESDKYLGDPELWKLAETAIAAAATGAGLSTVETRGEAAFYGPKIDFMVRDSLGREWQCATIQLDFVQPERFGLSYVDSEGQEKRPVMIHKALLGSIERFLSVYIEHTGGAFPTWISPEQVRLAPVNDTEPILRYARQLQDEMRALGIRVELDDSAESVGKKIRAAGLAKVPYTIVVGPKEVESGQVSPRLRKGHGTDPGEISLQTFVDGLTREIAERAPRSVFARDAHEAA